MLNKKLNMVVLVAALAAVVSAPVLAAPSAKFAAIWSETEASVVRAEACADAGTVDTTYCTDAGLGNTGEVVGTTLATIKVPSSKELLVGVSAQVELFTETLAKGKKGTTSSALAMAEGGVELLACSEAGCFMGKPGRVVLNKRTQELEATLAGVIEECTVDVQVDTDTGTGSGTFNLDDCTVEDEAIKLALTTMSAHHFNFVFPDLPQGDYSIIAKFSTNAAATASVTCGDEYTYCAVEDGGAGGSAYAVIGKYMMTIQEVRAVQGSLGSGEIQLEVQ